MAVNAKKKIGWIRLGIKRLAEAVSPIMNKYQLIAFISGLVYKGFTLYLIIELGGGSLWDAIKAYLRI